MIKHIRLVCAYDRNFKNVKKRNQYDEFLHKIQQQKMKELWDNKEDKTWENT